MGCRAVGSLALLLGIRPPGRWGLWCRVVWGMFALCLQPGLDWIA